MMADRRAGRKKRAPDQLPRLDAAGSELLAWLKSDEAACQRLKRTLRRDAQPVKDQLLKILRDEAKADSRKLSRLVAEAKRGCPFADEAVMRLARDIERPIIKRFLLWKLASTERHKPLRTTRLKSMERNQAVVEMMARLMEQQACRPSGIEAAAGCVVDVLRHLEINDMEVERVRQLWLLRGTLLPQEAEDFDLYRANGISFEEYISRLANPAANKKSARPNESPRSAVILPYAPRQKPA